METWKPMESAPKDRRILLAYDELGRRVVCGQWDNDPYSKSPWPHFTNDLCFLYGRNFAKRIQPVAWMELPAFDGFGHGEVVDLEAGTVVRHKRHGDMFRIVRPLERDVVIQSTDTLDRYVVRLDGFYERFEEVK